MPAGDNEGDGITIKFEDSTVLVYVATVSDEIPCVYCKSDLCVSVCILQVRSVCINVYIASQICVYLCVYCKPDLCVSVCICVYIASQITTPTSVLVHWPASLTGLLALT